MAVTFLDSVAHYASTEMVQKCWSVAFYAGSWEIAATASPAGGPMLKMAGSPSLSPWGFRRAGPNTETVHVGARYKFGSLAAFAQGLTCMEFVSSGWLCVMVGVTPGGAITAYRAVWNASDGVTGLNGTVVGMASLLGTSATTPIVAGGYYYIECECTLSDTAGVVKVWVNGALVLSISGVQTTVYHIIGAAGGCSGLIDIVGFGAAQPSGMYAYVGEVYIGTAEIGDLRVDAHFPDAFGTDRDWTLSSGSAEDDLLDETAANTTDYLETDTVGDQSSVSFTPLINAGGVITAVQVTGYLTKQNAGPCCVTPYALIGGTRYYGDGWYPSWGTWRFFMHVWNTNPATGVAWTESGFNGAEFGAKRTA